MKVIMTLAIFVIIGLSVFLIYREAEPNIEEFSTAFSDPKNTASANVFPNSTQLMDSDLEGTSSSNSYQHQAVPADIDFTEGNFKKNLSKFPSIEQVTEGYEHLADLGHIDDENYQAYKQYDISTLEKMGNQGDFVALDVLAEKYSEKNETQKQIDTWQKAAMFGSTSVAVGLADFNLGFVEEFSDRPELQETVLTEGFAWLKFAMMRGDPTIESVLKRQLQKLDRTEESVDWIRIQKRADEIYQHLEGERSARGIPQFENKNLEYMKPLFSNSL